MTPYKTWVWLFIQKNISRIFVDKLSTIFARNQTQSNTIISKSGPANKATAISLANDYCNSLQFGFAEKYKTSLQRVQKCLAQVVTRSSRTPAQVTALVAY